MICEKCDGNMGPARRDGSDMVYYCSKCGNTVRVAEPTKAEKKGKKH